MDLNNINFQLMAGLLFLVKVLNGFVKMCLNKKYLELLEKYKMELTELYIKAGYPYDHFFEKIKYLKHY